MKRSHFNEYIDRCDFVNLFNELGWNHVSRADRINPINIDDEAYDITPVADKQGFKALTCHVKEIPQHSIRRRIDLQLRRYFHNYILIFIKENSHNHLWMVPIKA